MLEAHQCGVVGVVHDKLTKGEHLNRIVSKRVNLFFTSQSSGTHLRELRAHRVLQVLGLGLGHLAGAEIEHLLAQQLEDHHVVLAQRFVRLRGPDDVRDETLPILRPLPEYDQG